MLSNRSLASKLNQTPNELLGRALNSLSWLRSEKERLTDRAPFAWQTTLEKGRTVTGVPMYLETPQQGMHADDQQRPKGSGRDRVAAHTLPYAATGSRAD